MGVTSGTKGSRRAGNMAALQRDNAHTLHDQIAAQLRGYITANYQPGLQLPTEGELMRRYAVSRSTVSKAVKHLTDEGLLFRRRGKGTFMAHAVPKVIHSLDRLTSFFETIQQAGTEFDTEIIDFFSEDAPDLPPVLEEFERPTFTFLRLYRSRGVPHGLTRVRVPYYIGRHLSRADLDSTPIYDVLKGKFGLRLTKVDYLISCLQPTAAIAKLLKQPRSTFLLVLDRISYDESGKPVEVTTHFLRPDVYQFSVSIDALIPCARP